MVNSKPGLRKTGTDKIIADARLTQKNTQSIKIKVSGSGPIGSTKTNTNRQITGTFLSTLGGAIQGSIGFPPNLTTISSNAIDISQLQTGHVIITGGGTLKTINGNHYDGEVLFIEGTQSTTIIIDNTGNIETLDGTTYNLVDDDIWIFMYDSTDAKWQQLTIGKQTMKTLTNDINANLKNIQGINNLSVAGNTILGDSTSDTISALAKFNLDIAFTNGKTIDFPNNATTATGGAITPPAQVTGYILAKLSGTVIKIPYYTF